MSKDIRSYFGNTSTSSSIKEKKDQDHQVRKRRKRILDSDEEDECIAPKSCKKQSVKKNEKVEVIVDVKDFFDKTPVLQRKLKTESSPGTSASSNISCAEKSKIKKANDKSKKSADNNIEKLVFEKDEELEACFLNSSDEILGSDRGSFKKKKLNSSNEEISNLQSNKSEAKSEKSIRKVKQEIKKEKTLNNELLKKSDVSSENKKRNSEAYQRYLNRSGPKNPGSKEIPEASPDCLQGLVFVVTGILDSLEREEATDLIKKCGGRVTSQVSKKTNYLVIGDEPGESKVKKAEEFNIKKINEDELLLLIAKNSESKCRIKSFSSKTEDRTYENLSKKKNNDFQIINKAGNVADASHFQETQKKNQSNASEIDLCSEKETTETHCESMLWVEKYKPKSTKNIIGQGGEKSNVKKLIHWLQNWHNYHGTKSSKNATKPAPWNQNDDGSYFKAALLSGPPGVGKTTTAYLVCQELGFDSIEFNASDTRSKKLLQEDVSELLSIKSLKNFCQENEKGFANQVLIMDEVDGMAGSEDRGGIQELIQLIKRTKIPIIGICNDRSHPKMRSLVNYCFDVRFQRPPVKQIKAAMLSVCFKENINISGDALEELIISSNHDLRQILHRLSVLTFVDKTLPLEVARKDGFDGKKPLNLSPWEVVRKVFTASNNQASNINDKMDLFFQDYSLGPLFVQDGYLNVRPSKAGTSELQKMSLIYEAADSISNGDIIERTIRNKNSWNLLPVQAIFSSVLPGHYMSGTFQGRIDFPVWLGKHSKTRKLNRILQELYFSLCTHITGDNMAVNLDYLQFIKNYIVQPLVERGLDGVENAVKFMSSYSLTREDFDYILELSQWPGVKDSFSLLDSKIKAAFTRAVNKECQKVSCPKKVVIFNDNSEDLTETDEVFYEENDNVNSDPLIKMKKPKVQKEGAKKKNVTKKGRS